jgi:hypothetical protein
MHSLISHTVSTLDQLHSLLKSERSADWTESKRVSLVTMNRLRQIGHSEFSSKQFAVAFRMICQHMNIITGIMDSRYA